IEMVAVPGNHEMLYSRKVNDEWKEFPLAFSTDVWMKHMADYMPAKRDHVTGSDSLVNRMTFSFIRKNIGFIVMNTDTYNSPTPNSKYGKEGLIPLSWVLNKIQEYQQLGSVEHIFLLGHRPYYVNGNPVVDHAGLPDGPVLWPAMNKAGVTALLSAHVHDYQRYQPGGKGAYQIIAGNAGSDGEATFFGYTTINVHKSGKTRLIAKGFDIGDPYTTVTDGSSTIRDSTTLLLSKNGNPYPDN
ncbi:MAG: metallophosphoesterase, partial [Cyclobacteriaceae bacterium]